MIKKIMILFIAVLISSCERLIYIEGNIYDASTRESIENAQAVLVVNHKDTLQKIHFEFDTLSYSERKKLRKAGAKDSYKDNNGEGLSIVTNALSDKNGNFTIGLLVFPAIYKSNIQLVINRNGYYIFSKNIDSLKHDSLKVFLEKHPD